MYKPHRKRGFHAYKYGRQLYKDIPVLSYLRTHVGQPWDDVFSKIAKLLKNDPHGGRDAWIPVETSCYRGTDGLVYSCNKWGVFAVNERYWRRSEFYVEPETGILREMHRAEPEVKYAPTTEIPLDADREYRKIDGIWYLLEYGEVVESWRVFRGKDISTGRPIFETNRSKLREVISKKQLGKKQLRGLRQRFPYAFPQPL